MIIWEIEKQAMNVGINVALRLSKFDGVNFTLEYYVSKLDLNPLLRIITSAREKNEDWNISFREILSIDDIRTMNDQLT